ncbi:MAG: ABC transporter permease [Clostridia bacterium]|nr:ABC transporter permease [Clostridia bacterium]
MKSWLAFFTASFKQMVRNRQAIFWTLFFPVVFMTMMGFFGRNSTPDVKVLIVDLDRSPASQQVAEALAHVPVFKAKEASSEAAARKQVADAKADAAIVLPEGFGAHLQAALLGQGEADLRVLYGNANPVKAAQTRGMLESTIEHVGLGLARRTSPIVTRSEAIGTTATGYLEFVVPGLLAMMMMNSGLFSIANVVTRWRDRGVLKRLRATTVTPTTIVTAWVTNQMVSGFLSVVLLLGLALGVFKAHLTVHAMTIVVLTILGMGVFFAIGFFLAGIAKDSEAVVPLVNLVSLPMMFLSGIFFPNDTLPRWLFKIVHYLPLTYLADGLRSTLTSGATLATLRADVAALAVWLLVSIVGSVRTFRWE